MNEERRKEGKKERWNKINQFSMIEKEKRGKKKRGKKIGK